MLNMLKTFKCTICTSENCTELLKITNPDRFELSMGIKSSGYTRHWVRCDKCGVAANIHTLTNLELIRNTSTSYYDVDLHSTSVAEKYAKVMALPLEKSDNYQRVKRIQFFLENWRQIFKLDKEPLSLLDIGAGTGVFLARFLGEETLQGKTWRAVAVEPDPLASNHLKFLNKFEVIGTSYTGQNELRNFNFCTLNKILEHIENPAEFLNKLKKALSGENGIIYIEVPDLITLYHRPSSDNILGALHFHLYNFESLSYLLNLAGIVPIQINRIFEPSGKISLACFATLPSVVNQLATKEP